MRIKITISYDGTTYDGWQSQKSGNTIQQTVENAILTLTGEKVTVTASGRTDSGVHAEGQVAHFDTECSIPAERFYLALNTVLPNDIRAVKSSEVSANFNARKSAKRKTYRYSAYVSEVVIPTKSRFAVRINAVDIDKMRSAARLIVGTHDFKAFSSSGSSVKTTTRTIYSCEVDSFGNDIFITVCGNGFLYNMVRIIAGTLIAIGANKLDENRISQAFLLKDRTLLAKTMSPEGLTLVEVRYDD